MVILWPGRWLPFFVLPLAVCFWLPRGCAAMTGCPQVIYHARPSHPCPDSLPSEISFRGKIRQGRHPQQVYIPMYCLKQLNRVTSVPNLASLQVGPARYYPSTVQKYRRDFDSYDDWNIDRYTFNTPYYWHTYRYAARRQLYTDPVPNSLGFDGPAFWSRYKWYTDWLNPTYWRRYRDPNYDRPMWNSWQPWQYDRSNIKRAINLYRNGIVDFKTLDSKWITPSAYGRYGKDWADVYLPAARYGAHRYFYSWS